MPFVDLPDHRIHYALSGRQNASTLVLSNSLGTNFSMWDPQLAEFEKHFSVLRYDTRGHGKSAIPRGPYTFDQLGRDVVGLLNALKIESAYFCGLSMGGMTGLWLALHAANRLRKMIVSSASAKFGTTETWEKRIAAVRQGGMKSVAQQVVERWYTPEFRTSEPEAARATLQMLEATSAEGYIACCAALRDEDVRESIQRIRTPTLIISGALDPVSPPADGKYLCGVIPSAQYRELEAAHLTNIEASGDFTREVVSFLTLEGA
jgi:3-oxoadipate enol-lactonase